MLEANGWDVTREFYYNDAGAQIDNLALSVQARAQGPDARRRRLAGGRLPRRLHPGRRPGLPRAATASRCEGHARHRRAGDADDLDAIRRFAVACLRREQNLDLAAFGVAFDVYFLESSLYADGKVEETVRELVRHGHTYEEGGALWLRTTDFGDDKDRVMRKSDGTLHLLRAGRRLPPQQVAARLRARDHRARRRPPRLAGARAGRPAGARRRHPAGLSGIRAAPDGHGDARRRGSEALQARRQLPDAARPDRRSRPRRDALVPDRAQARFAARSSTSIWRARSRSTIPVYYVQLSHARICGLLRQLNERGLSFDLDNGLAQPLDLDRRRDARPAHRPVALSRSRRRRRRATRTAPARRSTCTNWRRRSRRITTITSSWSTTPTRAMRAWRWRWRRGRCWRTDWTWWAFRRRRRCKAMAVKRGKSQARRNSGSNSSGLPGWAWLVLGVVLTLGVILAAPRFLKSDGQDGFFRPRPNPDARPAAATGDADDDGVVPEPASTDAAKATAARAASRRRRKRSSTSTPCCPARKSPCPTPNSPPARARKRRRAQREQAQQAAAAQRAGGTHADQSIASGHDDAVDPGHGHRRDHDADHRRRQSAGNDTRYLLQAGAFGASGDAEALKARIALLGLGARVESAQHQRQDHVPRAHGAVWHRVGTRRGQGQARQRRPAGDGDQGEVSGRARRRGSLRGVTVWRAGVATGEMARSHNASPREKHAWPSKPH